MNSTFIAGAALAIAMILTPQLRADDLLFEGKGTKASLIELYSSEGCSSCPPAEAWLNGLKTAPGLWRDIFPVAFHVNYWDNLGWPDRFASAPFTQRQYDYASRLGQESVYTPEFVVDGREWQRGWLSSRLPDQSEKSGDLAVTVHATDGQISARYVAPTALSEKALALNVALLGFNAVSDVQRGENSGQKLQHDFVILGFRTVPLTEDKSGTFSANSFTVPVIAGEKPGAVVAWISDRDGKIVQIAGGWLAKNATAKE